MQRPYIRQMQRRVGGLNVQWSNPAGRIASRFLSKDNAFLKYEFGEGAYTRDSGILKVKTSDSEKNNTRKDTLVLLRDADPRATAPGALPEMQEEDLVLKVHGHGSEETTKYLLLLLAETTGFPTA